MLIVDGGAEGLGASLVGIGVDGIGAGFVGSTGADGGRVGLCDKTSVVESDKPIRWVCVN